MSALDLTGADLIRALGASPRGRRSTRPCASGPRRSPRAIADAAARGATTVASRRGAGDYAVAVSAPGCSRGNSGRWMRRPSR